MSSTWAHSPASSSSKGVRGSVSPLVQRRLYLTWSRQAELFGQTKTLQFAGRAFREFFYNRYLLRHFKGGQACRSKQAYIILRSHSTLMQHHGGGNILP